METNSFKDTKTKFFNLILDNGVSLSLACSFCFVVYYIVHQHNIQLMQAISELRDEKKELIETIIECYKLKE